MYIALSFSLPMMPTHPYKIIIANDQAEQLYLHAAAVVASKNILLGMVSNGAALIKLVAKQKPDIVLCDLVMPKMNGIDACCEIKKIAPETICIITTSFSEMNSYFKAAYHKLNGFLFNPVTDQKLNLCLQQITQEKKFHIDLTYRRDFFSALIKISKELNALSKHEELSKLNELMELLELSNDDKKALQDEGALTFHKLKHNGRPVKITDKHVLIVSAIYHCMQRAEIANLMNISNDTVDTKIKRLKAELSIEDRIELIKLFQDWGFVKSKHEM